LGNWDGIRRLALSVHFMSDSPADPLVGRLVAGRYRVLRPLGEGGMGQVYLAEHEVIEKKIALKVLRPEFSRKEDIISRFQQEAISASRIKHPNVLEVFDFGRLESGEAFLAMEFLEGHDLSDELARAGVLDPSRALPIAMQICRALAAAHARGVVHRDMKPDNVFLQRTTDGEIVKIVDFGIAQLRSTEEAAKSEPRRRRLTKTGMIFGTPEYMAPEQAGGRTADHRVDVYAVGVILYEMFSGAVPFTGDSFIAVLSAAVHEPPPLLTAVNPDLRISAEMQGVIMRALAKSPTDRFPSMNEFMAAILATPEGIAFGRSIGPLPHVGFSSAPPEHAVPTAAQFGAAPNTLIVNQSGATLVSPGDTAAIGTPETIVASDSGEVRAAIGMPKTLLSQENSGATDAQGARTLVVPDSAADPPTATAAGPPATAVGESRPAVTSAPIETGRPKLGIALAAIVVLGAAGYFGYSRSQQGEATANPSKEDPARASVSPEPEATARAAPVVAVAPPVTATSATVEPTTEPSKEVTLHVVTEPPGAVLLKAGFQVCDTTPCDITVTRNDPIELEARKASLKGQARILAQHTQAVTINLSGPQPKPKPATGPRMCEVEVQGLKILRPCQQ
jgi:serine/threonine protein kinase